MQSVSVSVAALAILFVGLACAHPIYQSVELGDKECPDKKTNCSSTATCCHISQTEYGCCKYQSAVCCSDKLHCCPSGTKCDTTNGVCTKAENDKLFAMEKIECDISAPKTVTCPDKSTCPDENTCCQLIGQDKYGCCPLKAAVCCKDGLHCCPTDYSCNKDGSCTDIFLAVLMQRKISKKKPAMSLQSTTFSVKLPTDILCPDHKTKCPDANTCCALTDGSYGCCPQNNGVCCSDHKHCCPEGYTCDLEDNTCTKVDSVFPLLTKSAPLKSPESVVCPDGQSQCEDGQTCCKLSSGQYGCCPLPKAVCCSDGVHCCPSGYTCDVSDGTCTKQGERIAFFEKVSAKKAPESVVCPDGQSQCEDGQTCCKLSSGQYGCCPLPKAVCCSDGVHCCPSGYTCDVSDGTCTKLGEKIAFFEKVIAQKFPPTNPYYMKFDHDFL